MNLLLILSACSGDDGLKAFNNEPMATIVEPADGSEAQEGRAVEFTGRVTDENHEVSELLVTWRVDGVDAWGPFVPDARGESRAELSLAAGVHEVLLLVEDPDLATGSDTISVSVLETAPPQAQILAPEDGSVFDVTDLVNLGGLVSDAEDPASELTVWWESSLQDLSTVNVIVNSDGTTSAASEFDVGTHLLTFNVRDSDGKTDSDNVTITVEPAPGAPVCWIAEPSENSLVDVEDGLLLEGQVQDDDQPVETLVASWSSDIDGLLGGSSPSAEGLVSRKVDLSIGSHLLTLFVEDEDGLTCTDNVRVFVDSAPTLEILSPETGGTVNQGERLIVQVLAQDATDAEDELLVEIESDIDGSLGVEAPDSTGELSFSLDALSPGDHALLLRVTDTVGFTAVASLGVTVNALPSPLEIALSPSAPTTDDALTVSITSASVDPEGGAVSYAYAWTRDGGASGHAGATVPASATTKDEVWSVSVVASDPLGAESPVATASVTIQDSPPVISLLSLSPEAPTVEDPIEAAVSSADADGETVVYSYAWTVNGIAHPSSGSSISTGYAKADEVQVVVTPVAGGESGATRSASVVVVNSPPTAPVVSVTPAEPYAGDDTLTCAISRFSTDADDDDISYAVEWTVDGVDAGLVGYTVDRDELNPGEFWVCTVTPSDGEEDGASAYSGVTVLGDPVDYAHIQFPCSLVLGRGDEGDVYGWTYEPGVTAGSGRGGDIEAQAGVGPTDVDPRDDELSWTWFDAVYNADRDGLAPGDQANDEYLARVTAPSTTGDYAYVIRFSSDFGASWVYADLGPNSGCGGLGTTDGFDLADAGLLTVIP